MSHYFKLLVFLFLFATSPIVQAQIFQWGSSLNGTNSTNSIGIGTDAAGNSYLAGKFWQTVDLDPGPGIANRTSQGSSDIFFVKLDANHNFVWGKTIRGIDQNQIEDFTVDQQGNIYATGSFRGTVDFDPGPGTHNLVANLSFDAFILKLDATGALVWVHSYHAGVSELGQAITLDKAGNVYFSGTFSDTLDADPGPGNFPLIAINSTNTFIIKLNPAGNFIWGKHFSRGIMINYAIHVNQNGDVFCSGIFHQQVDFDPGPGQYNLNSTGFNDGFLTKLDSLGNFCWAKQWVGDLAVGKSVTTNANGDIFLAGHFSGTIDFDPGINTHQTSSTSLFSDAFLIQLDSGGNLVWLNHWGDALHDHANKVLLDSLGNIYVGGKYNGAVDADPGPGVYTLPVYGSEDASVSKFSAAGNLIWAVGFGGTQPDVIHSLSLDSFGNLYTIGEFAGSPCDLDPGPGNFSVTGIQATDVFISELSACQPSSDTISKTACGSYLSPGGTTVWTSSGTYTDTIRNAQGCDSLLTIHLSILTVDTSVSTSGSTLTANASNATFQWLNCNANFALIPGETAATYTPSTSGTFAVAVAVTQNGCTDTSACYTLLIVGQPKPFHANISAYPNPTTGLLYLDPGQVLPFTKVDISNVMGQRITQVKYTAAQQLVVKMPDTPGMYLVRVTGYGIPPHVFKIWKK